MTRAAKLSLAAILATALPAAAESPATDRAGNWVQLDSGEWIDLDATEVIEVFAERPDKVVNRDTELRLTGEELLARGVGDLAEALEEIPELAVRQAGRGGLQVNIRGGRKGAVKVLIDGVPVDEVFYGTFDLSSIPVTDIAQIRVSLAPASPLDGIGGPAGVIEVHTIDAVGRRQVRLRGQGSSSPQADLSATGRTEIAEGIAVRGSATAGLGRRDFAIANGDEMVELNEDKTQLTGALRFELRGSRERLVIDAFAQERSYLVPPGEDGTEIIRVIDSESSTRFSLLGDIERRRLKVQGRAYVQTLDRVSLQHMQPTLEDDAGEEHLVGTRAGTGFIANHPIGKRVQVLGAASIDSENGELEVATGTTSGTTTLSEIATGAQAELGIVHVDAAVGVAFPIGGAGDAPWPEAKLTAKVTPAAALEFKLILGRKGRLPTLRERFRSDIGNPDLEAEKASFIEVETTLHPTSRITLRTGAYIRDSDGMIRFDSNAAKLINVNDLVLRGFDSSGDIEISRYATAGATYSFTDAYSPQFGLESLDFLPRHRVEGRLGGRLGRGSATLRVRYQSTQIDQQIKLPTQTNVDLSAYARISGNLQASLRLENILGDEVLIRRGGVMSPGRVFMLTLQTRWE